MELLSFTEPSQLELAQIINRYNVFLRTST